MKKTLLVAIPLVAILVATLVAYMLVGNPKPGNPRKPTPYATTPIDTPTRNPLLKAEARLAHSLAPSPLNGLRFVAVPSLSDHSYAFQIAVHALGAPAKAILIVSPNAGGAKQRYRFNVPRQEETAFFRVVDAVLPTLGRGDGMDTDGTPAALERIRNGRSRTWTTNLTDPAWAPVNTAIRDILRRHAPPEALPAEADWHDAAAA